MSALIDKIQRFSVHDGDCWRWIGAAQSSKTPMMNWNGKASSVRRFIMDERNVSMKGYLAGTSCGNPLCVNPAHVVRTTRSKVSTDAAAKMDAASKMRRSMAISLKARDRAKLSMDIASAIRADDRPTRAIAAAYGIAQHTVQDIKAGNTWREYTATQNPFVQLMR